MIFTSLFGGNRASLTQMNEFRSSETICAGRNGSLSVSFLQSCFLYASVGCSSSSCRNGAPAAVSIPTILALTTTTSVAVCRPSVDLFAERRFLGTFSSLFASHGASRIVITLQIPSISELKLTRLRFRVDSNCEQSTFFHPHRFIVAGNQIFTDFEFWDRTHCLSQSTRLPIENSFTSLFSLIHRWLQYG
jgi:hypothetical protein